MMIPKVLIFVACFILISSCTKKEEKHIVIVDQGRPANDLVHETSPYLLEHAYNPVDWKAWNSESLELAKKENKLVVISIGYSACHWCHVMEEESFENDSIAALMNDNFISIKVDREERPDVDQIYMDAVQLMTGKGGWPLNCISLPDGRPVFGGTYFTKDQWTKVLVEMSDLYKKEPEKVIAYADRLTKGMKNKDLITVNKEAVAFNTKSLDALVNFWKPSLDLVDGGQQGAPKFPMPNQLLFLLRYSVQNNDKELQKHVENSLFKMANGGIYDQVGGGFSRYTVDEEWHIPHFEKMLYDNAQLVSLYAAAYQLTGNEYYKKIIEETLDFVHTELTQKDGAFYSSINADSKTNTGELREGAFYIWTKNELETIIDREIELFYSYYNINEARKWEDDTYILYKTKSDTAFLKEFGLTQQELNVLVSDWKSQLDTFREERERPSTDDKVLTSWNALMIKGYVDAYRVLGNKKYLARAIKSAEFITTKQLNKDGSLFHNYKDGRSTIEGFSEDYAHTIDAFISLYQVTLDEQWLVMASDLMKYSMIHFYDKNSGMFYFTSDQQTNLITRKTEVVDQVISSSNSVLAINLFQLGHYESNKDYSKISERMLSNVYKDIKTTPSAYANWLALYLNYSNPYYEVAISGSNAMEKIKELHSYYLPNILIAGATADSDLPIMKNRFNKDNTYIYVCVDGSCKLPVTDTERAVGQLLK
ncbi:thioredoxin domain-containing protein [Nonlabens sp.]|uniref:thioredoxin domain-containing protein n=1 Tax=Nonlabens sp. TaxID=1888209 RepID=UPI003451D746